MSRLRSVLSLLACMFCITSVAGGSDSCVRTKFGECFAIHGRYDLHIADGVEVLQPAGTHRLLRAMSGTKPIYTILCDRPFPCATASEFYIFGDFVVCPLQKDVPGEMRQVCVQHARNLRRVKRNGSN